jgi:hypothetical protein
VRLSPEWVTEPSARLQVVVEDEVGIRTHLARLVQQEAAVEVECGAVGGAHVPAQAEFQVGQARSFLRQVDVAAFLQTDCHDVYLPV